MSFFQIDRRSISNFDLVLFGLVVILNVLGIINLGSAATSSELWKTQLIWFLLSLPVAAAVLFIDYKRYERLAPLVYVCALGLLLGIHFLGREVSGSKSWYDLGLARLQPSEFTKIALIMVIARIYQGQAPDKKGGFRQLLLPGLLIALPVASVIMEPDFGTALIMVLLSGTMLLFAGISRSVLIAGALLVMVFVLSYPLWRGHLKPHHRQRIEVFAHPEKDPLGAGYNALQSKIAIGSGGLLGKGYKQGNVHMLRFLPEQHTDFVFSVWAEEWGFFWVVGVILLYMTVIMKGLLVSREAKDRLGEMLAVGSSALLFWHICINISMVSGLFPVIGVPLPFMSYGGSNLFTFMIAVSLILNVRMRKYQF